jgi:hypothetical protein
MQMISSSTLDPLTFQNYVYNLRRKYNSRALPPLMNQQFLNHETKKTYIPTTSQNQMPRILKPTSDHYQQLAAPSSYDPYYH